MKANLLGSDLYQLPDSSASYVSDFLSAFFSPFNIIISNSTISLNEGIPVLQSDRPAELPAIGDYLNDPSVLSGSYILVPSSGTTSTQKYIVHDKLSLMKSAKLFGDLLDDFIGIKIPAVSMSMRPGYMASIFNCILEPTVSDRSIYQPCVIPTFNQLSVALSSLFEYQGDIMLTIAPQTCVELSKILSAYNDDLPKISGTKVIVSTSDRLPPHTYLYFNTISENVHLYDCYGITDLGGSFAMTKAFDKDHVSMTLFGRSDFYMHNMQPFTSTTAIGYCNISTLQFTPFCSAFTSGDHLVASGTIGGFDFLGRVSETLLIGGQQAYASVIECEIELSPYISRCKIEQKPEDSSCALSIHYISSNFNISESELQADIRMRCASALSKLSVQPAPPLRFFRVAELPTTISGKIKR